MSTVIADPRYAASPQAPGDAGWRKTDLSETVVYVDCSAFAGRFIEVVAVTGAVYAAMVPTDSTSLDVVNTSGFEANVPRTIPEGQSIPFVIPGPKTTSGGDSPGRPFLAIRAVDTSAHAEAHIV